MTLVKQSAVEEIFQCPPHAFDVSLVICDVSFFEMDPEAQPLGQFFPLFGVSEDAFEAFSNERFDAEGLDFFLAVNAHLFTDLDLDGQAVGIPAGFSFTAVSSHGLIAGEEVLHGPRQAVARMGEPIGRGRPFIEHERRCIATCFERFLVNGVFLPQFSDGFFQFWEGNGTFNGLEHGVSLFLDRI